MNGLLVGATSLATTTLSVQAQSLFAGDWAIEESIQAVPPMHRKLYLNGTRAMDVRPDLEERHDEEPEETSVDGLSLRLTHQTTDFYVPLANPDTAMMIRRNYRSEGWTEGRHPADYVDRAFGAGWLSNLDARLAINYLGGKPVAASVVDEQGILHRFLLKPGVTVYSSLPSDETHQDVGHIRLRHTDGVYSLERKYKRTLLFDEVPTTVKGEDGSQTEYHRPTKVHDAFGMTIHYQYEDANTTLIPDRLEGGGSTFFITRNPAGKVSRVQDSSGGVSSYDYDATSIPECGPLLSVVTKNPGQAWPAATTYFYVAGRESKPGSVPEHNRLQLSSVRDARGSAYLFGYSVGEDPCDASDGRTTGFCLRDVSLPGGLGKSQFQRLHRSDQKELIETFVKNADGFPMLLSFSGFQVTETPLGDTTSIKFLGFTELKYTFYGEEKTPIESSWEGQPVPDAYNILGTHSFRFEPQAGYGLSSAKDSFGRTMVFQYRDRIRNRTEGLPFALFSRQPNQVILPGGKSRLLEYHPTHHTPIRVVDESGRVTATLLHEKYPRQISESIFATNQDEKNGMRLSETRKEYHDPQFPAFATSQRIVKLGKDGPEWEGDLITHFEPDSNGRVKNEIKDPGGIHALTTRAYDASGNLLSIRSDNQETRFVYDSSYRLVSVAKGSEEDGFNRTAENLYDQRGNKTAEIKPGQTTEFFFHDPLNRVTRKATDVNGNERYDFDVDESLTFGFNATGGVTMDYDQTGNRLNRVFDGLQRVSEFDLEGKHYRVSYGMNSGSVLFEGDEWNSTTIKCGEDWIERKYDAAGRLIKESYSPGWGGLQKDIKYDLAGNLVEEVFSDGRRVKRSFDKLNRLLEFSDTQGKTISHRYTSTGLHYHTTTDGNAEEVRYDATGTLEEKEPNPDDL